jgi:hypothetical protein
MDIRTSTYDEALSDYLGDADEAGVPYIEPREAVEHYGLFPEPYAEPYAVGTWLYFPADRERGEVYLRRV